MADRYKAQINRPDSGTYLDVYTDASNQYEAERIFKAQYPEHRIIGTHRIEEENHSDSSNSGCAGAVAAFALVPFGCLILRFAS